MTNGFLGDAASPAHFLRNFTLSRSFLPLHLSLAHVGNHLARLAKVHELETTPQLAFEIFNHATHIRNMASLHAALDFHLSLIRARDAAAYLEAAAGLER